MVEPNTVDRKNKPLKCVCGTCGTCKSRERQRRYRSNPSDLERLRANDRRRSKKRQAKTIQYVREWRARNPAAYRAQGLLGHAVAEGRVVKGPCEKAGADCRGSVEAHHDDYEKPFDVRWLCKEHHELHHHRERQA